ncbi:MAG: beta-ketoacyl synthase N-terminal-like domain-containing protein [Caldilineaceae bacterium]
MRQFLQTRLPDYMIPAVITLVVALPRLPNGKVDRRNLPAPALPATTATMTPDANFVAPRSEIETTIAAVWAEVLQRPTVGIHENFFDLGGHSLLLLRVHHQLQARLAQPVAVIDLFQFPTISALSEHLSQSTVPSQPVHQPPPAAPVVATQEGIAIIGMSCRFPGARTVTAFWQNLYDGIESLLLIPDAELLAAGIDPALVQNPSYVKRMGRLADIDHFDAAFFGYSAREAAATDPQHRIFMECAWEALERAGYAPQRYQGRIGVFAGSGFNSYRALHLTGNAELTRTLGDYQIAVSNEGDAMPTHVSYKLNLTGPSLAVNTACSTSLVAVHVAAQSILNGECEMALAGGVTIHAQQTQGYYYEEGMILSPDGHCRAFDAQAQGTAAGNGAGVVLLKRLTAALADGDPIYAVIKGSAINNDGARKVGYTAPSVEGQTQVILAAQANAGVAAATISYIETHGTGTLLGDPIEVAALTQAFRQSTMDKGFCAIGAVKTNIGHLDTAAGIAGLIKTALALHHKTIPPSLHFTTPNPQIDFANSPFYVNAQRTAWPAGDAPRRAGVSSFGIGGTNAHVILEEAPPPARPEGPRPHPSRTSLGGGTHDTVTGQLPPPQLEGGISDTVTAQLLPPQAGEGWGGVARPWQLLLLSARSATALETMTDNLAAHLLAHPDLDLADVAYTLSVGRTLFPHRRVVICTNTADAIRVLTQRDPQRLLTQHAPTVSKERSVAFLCSGQGSQYVNMGRALYASEPLFRQTVDHCCELLLPQLGFDLRTVLYPDDEVTRWQGDKGTGEKVTGDR